MKAKRNGQALPAAAEEALAAGRVIEAIKIVRAESGVGLAEARQRVAAAQRHAAAPHGRVDVALPPAAIAALERGKVIEAVKAVRAARGEGLKAAKAEVDRYRAAHPETRHPVHMNESHGGRTLLIGVLIAAAVWLLLR